MASAQFLIRPDLEERVNHLLAKMTLEEKIGQTNQVHNFDEPQREAIRQGRIGSILNASDAFAGKSASPSTRAEICNECQKIAMEGSRLGIPVLFGRDVIHGFRTVFPIPLAQSAAWDADLVQQAASIAASEATSTGLKWTFSPMLDIARDPRWGRVAEGYGEDPYLASQLAAASVLGFQGNDMADPDKLVACAKHFAGYGAAEGGRDYDGAEISNRTMRDVYLPSFKAAVDAGVGTIMAAFHDLNGVPISANRALLTDVLRGEWGFSGFVVSDWTSVIELVNHGVAGDAGDAAVLALRAGVDMDMISDAFISNLANRLKLSQISQQEIDEAVRRILRIKMLAGLFEKPYTDTSRAAKAIRSTESLELSRKFATQTVVLLKNQNDVLPLGKHFKHIAVVGPMVNAKEDLFGTWTPDGHAEDATSIVDAIRQSAPHGIEFGFSDTVDEAMRMVQQSDAAVVVLGEHPWRSGENSNVSSLELPPGQRQFVEVVANQGKPVILVILAGRPLAITHELRLADAILYAWHPGSEGGFAIADLLFGLAVPCGKLPITMPRATGQVPIYYAHKNSGRPGGVEPFLTRYVDLPYGPLFPFGFGLSYTQFSYSNLHVSALRFKSGRNHISADITNTGAMAGTEIAQLYIRDLVGSVTRPVRQLKGFRKIHLKAGETQKVEFDLQPEDLAFTGMDDKPVIEPGDFKVWVGPNSSEGLQGEFTLY